MSDTRSKVQAAPEGSWKSEQEGKLPSDCLARWAMPAARRSI